MYRTYYIVDRADGTLVGAFNADKVGDESGAINAARDLMALEDGCRTGVALRVRKCVKWEE